MSLRMIAVAAVLFLFSLKSYSVINLVSISGASAQDLSNATKPIIYAGFAGTCSGDGTSTCNSCTGSLTSCNFKNAYPNLVLTIRVSSTSTGASSSNATLKIADKVFTPSIPLSYADGILTAQLYWGEICNHTEVGAGTECDGKSFTVDLALGFDLSTSGAGINESKSFKLVGRVAAADAHDTYTDCDTNPATGNTGFCHFEAYPGDGKIYADNLVVSSGYPNSPASGIEYSEVIFFYEKGAEGDDAHIISSINNGSNYFTVAVNKSANPPIADNRIEGLDNGTRYCMLMANQDITGVISYFTPNSASALCATPSQVVGLLDDKHCFIATAAFGSQLAPQVQAFREFRNRFLLTNSLGQNFVRAYYKYSPELANMISQHEWTRSGARGVLWPLLIFAQLSLHFGFVSMLVIMLSLLVGIIWVTRNWIGKYLRSPR